MYQEQVTNGKGYLHQGKGQGPFYKIDKGKGDVMFMNYGYGHQSGS